MTRLLDSGRVVSESARGDGRSHRLVREATKVSQVHPMFSFKWG